MHPTLTRFASTLPWYLVLAAATATAAPPSYRRVLERTAGMVNSDRAYSLVQARGLDLVNVMWEDTGRYYGSSVGPNISDVTIQVLERRQVGGRERLRTYLMPVIRYPNYSDKTGDVPIDRISLLVGNEDGQSLRPVLLEDFLSDLRAHLSTPDSWKGERRSLLAKRDSHVLVSAQAAFLPIPANGGATFNPVVFNYQSGRKNPAVLTILATREGTSVTVIDNHRDAFDAGGVWGQRLFFNQGGKRASFTGERQSDFVENGGDMTSPSPTIGDEAGLNMVMLIQVPLKHRAPRPMVAYGGIATKSGDGLGSGGGNLKSGAQERQRSDVENAVIGHGDLDGPFTEIDGLPIERDTRFPIRVTVQFYKATSNGVLSRADVKQVKEQIRRVYKEADYVGSLVTQGYTGRPTEWDGDHREPAGWWDGFWQHYQAETGLTAEATDRILSERVYPRWVAVGGRSCPPDDPARWLCVPAQTSPAD